MNTTINNRHSAIKEALDSTEVIGQFVTLKRSGSSYTGLCPFHNEHKPSFSVSPAKGLYHCFGCDASGDTITFLQQHLCISYKEAMQWLGDHYHLPLEDSRNAYSDKPSRTKTCIATFVPPPPPEPEPEIQEPLTTSSFTMREYMEGSIRNLAENNLVLFLRTLFDDVLVSKLIHTYWLGTSKYYPGGTILWQVDERGHVRTGKIMPFDAVTGRRNRQAFPPSNWVHSVLRLPDFKLQQCFFGQHLLAGYPNRPVAIVESEKTAIIASVYMPQFTWLASGGKSNLSAEKFKCLEEFHVTLFPDLGAHEEWAKFARQMRHILNIKVNNLLQEVSSAYNLPDKSDLCDYLTGPAFRRDMINRFKRTLTAHPDHTEEGQWKVWERSRDIGMRAEDRVIAMKELIREGVFDGPEGWRDYPA